jgi:hypothetical protein
MRFHFNTVHPALSVRYQLEYRNNALGIDFIAYRYGTIAANQSATIDQDLRTIAAQEGFNLGPTGGGVTTWNLMGWATWNQPGNADGILSGSGAQWWNLTC